MPSTASSSTTSSASRSTLAAIVAALVLAAWFVHSAIDAFPTQLGIDFYQFWGVPLARDAGAIAETPYVAQPRYAGVLNAKADASANAKFRNANRLRRSLEPMGTPFLYAAFSPFPADYETAQLGYTALLYAAAGAAVFALARLWGMAAWPSLCVALLVLLTSNPFAQDVRSGNVNSLQLALVVALVAVSARRRFTGNDWVDGLFMGALALMVAFKPNTPWIAIALGLHYAAARGARAFTIGAVEAALLGAAAFAIGAWRFGGAHAWTEWLALARGLDGSGLALPLERGNLSIPMILSRASPALGSAAWGLAMAAALALALVMAFSDRGRDGAGALAAARRGFADPWFAASVGIVFTFATSPLVWPHYYVLALVPMAWLLAADSSCRPCRWGAIVSYLALSRLAIDPLVGLQAYGVLQFLSVTAWLALLPGILAHAQAARGATTPPEPAAATRGT